MYERTLDYLSKMYELCADIGEFVQEMAIDEFLRDKRTQNAVAMSLIALGEVANTLYQKDPTFIQSNPDIAWKYMRGMRNVIAHGYFSLDLEVVYHTATQSIPTLATQLQSIMTTLSTRADN